MRILALGLVLVTGAGTVSAAELADPREYASDDYSAQVFYRLEFGGRQPGAQSLGLRLDNERAATAGAPALLQARLGDQGLAQFSVNGVDLRGTLLSSGEDSGGGFFSKISVAQWIALGFTTLVLGNVIAGATEDTDVPNPTATGFGG